MLVGDWSEEIQEGGRLARKNDDRYDWMCDADTTTAGAIAMPVATAIAMATATSMHCHCHCHKSHLPFSLVL